MIHTVISSKSDSVAVFISLFSKILFKACQHSLIIPVKMSSPFLPPRRPTGTSLSSCWLLLPCHHLILFLRHPPTDHQMQPTAAAAVTAAVAAADFFVATPTTTIAKKTTSWSPLFLLVASLSSLLIAPRLQRQWVPALPSP